MRNTFYKILYSLSPGFKVFGKKRLRVLAYHDVIDEESFEKQLLYLKKNYSVIDLETLKKHLFQGVSLPDYPLLITFDDGDASVLSKGLPILQKQGLPARLFVITELIGTTIDFWWERVRAGERKSGKNSAEIRMEVNRLKNLKNVDRIQELEKYETSHRNQLSPTDLKKLQSGGVKIANHSHTHPMFDYCTDVEIKNELSQVESCFSRWGIGDYTVFAYPNGNYDIRAEKILVEENIKIAFLFDHKINKKVINPLRISRIRVDSDTAIKEFGVKVSGLHPFIMRENKNIRLF